MERVADIVDTDSYLPFACPKCGEGATASPLEECLQCVAEAQKAKAAADKLTKETYEKYPEIKGGTHLGQGMS